MKLTHLARYFLTLVMSLQLLIPVAHAAASPAATVPRHARYRISLNGFKVNQETWDNAFQVDGKRDEVFLRADVRVADKSGNVLLQDESRSSVMGDINGYAGRVQAGSASSTGGLRTGDPFPTSTPWVRSGDLMHDRPPMQMIEVDLTEGENGVAIVPSVWEWDGGTDMFTEWGQLIANHGADLGAAIATIVTGPAATDASPSTFIKDGLSMGLPALFSIASGIFGQAKDRPIGMTPKGSDYEFNSKVLVLTYQSAELALHTDFGEGPGVFGVVYTDAGSLGAGSYTVYFQVERLTPYDLTPPETAIDSGPTGTVNNASASFAFSSSEPDSSFECSLDGAAFSGCSSPAQYTGLSDGSHTFQARATDAAGNLDATPAVRTWAVDTLAPSLSGPPLQSLISNSTLGTSTIPLRVTWTAASDAGSGIRGYQVQQRQMSGTAWGAWTNATAFTAARSITRGLAPGTYQFQVRAQDGAGNWGAYRTGAAFALSVAQETSTAVTYSTGWTAAALTGAFGGSVKFASASTARATYTFSGRSVAWVSTRAGDRGQADVLVDGVKVTTVDLSSTTLLTRKVVFVKTGLSPTTTHKLEIRVLGTAGRPRVDLDAFAVVR
jgi:hypothetical protein